MTIKIFSLTDDSGLEQALEEESGSGDWLPAGMVCREPHFTPSLVHLPGGGTIGGMTMGGPGGPMTIAIGSTKRWRESFGKHGRGEISDDEFLDSVANLNLDPAAFRPDQVWFSPEHPLPMPATPKGKRPRSWASQRARSNPVSRSRRRRGSDPFGLPGAGGGPPTPRVATRR